MVGEPLQNMEDGGIKEGFNGMLFDVKCGEDVDSYVAKFIQKDNQLEILNEIKYHRKAAEAGLAPNIYEFRLYKGDGIIQCTIIMDRMDKTIEELELKNPSPEYKAALIQEANSLVERLHALKIFHGDFAKKNIMSGRIDPALKLIDFGESREYRGQPENDLSVKHHYTLHLRPRRKKSVSRKKKSVSRKKKSVSRRKKSVSRKKKSVSRKRNK